MPVLSASCRIYVRTIKIKIRLNPFTLMKQKLIDCEVLNDGNPIDLERQYITLKGR